MLVCTLCKPLFTFITLFILQQVTPVAPFSAQFQLLGTFQGDFPGSKTPWYTPSLSRHTASFSRYDPPNRILRSRTRTGPDRTRTRTRKDPTPPMKTGLPWELQPHIIPIGSTCKYYYLAKFQPASAWIARDMVSARSFPALLGLVLT